jgi:hypothetical protein
LDLVYAVCCERWTRGCWRAAAEVDKPLQARQAVVSRATSAPPRTRPVACTRGGWSEPVVRLFRRIQDKVRNKLTQRQYENEVSWSTSTWLAQQAQRLSVRGGAHSFGVGDRDRDAG